MQETSKDVEVNGQRYRISRIDARPGSWIAMQIAGYVLPMGMDESVAASAPKGRQEMPEDTFYRVQNYSLSVVSRYPPNADAPPAPVLVEGRFAFPDLEKDVVTVLELTLNSLIFNVSPFFSGGALKRIFTSFKGLVPSSAPNSTPS